MPKSWTPSHLFFLFAVLFSLFLFRSPTEMVISGALYAFVDAFVLPRSLSVRAVFPLSMLFLFLLILSETPEKVYTLALYYTVRGLIVFRSLILLLFDVQKSEEKISKAMIAAIGGFVIELGVVAIFLYSTFKPFAVDVSILQVAKWISLKGFLFATAPLIYQRLHFKNGEVIN